MLAPDSRVEDPTAVNERSSWRLARMDESIHGNIPIVDVLNEGKAGVNDSSDVEQPFSLIGSNASVPFRVNDDARRVRERQRSEFVLRLDPKDIRQNERENGGSDHLKA
jgi:hypothetical protein